MTYHEKKVFACYLCGKNDLRDNNHFNQHVAVCKKKQMKKNGSSNAEMGPPTPKKMIEEAKKEE
jgi:hypothetical protein